MSIKFLKNGTNTSDATATADDIIEPKTAYVNEGKVTGTIANNRDVIITPTTEEQIKSNGYYNSLKIEAVDSNIDSNIVAENIKYGISILGTEGSFTNDADAVSGDIAYQKIAYVNGEKVIGKITDLLDINKTDSNIYTGDTIILTKQLGQLNGGEGVSFPAVGVLDTNKYQFMIFMNDIYYLITCSSPCTYSDAYGYDVLFGAGRGKHYKFDNGEWISSSIPNFQFETDTNNLRINNMKVINVMYGSTFDIKYNWDSSGRIWYAKNTDVTIEKHLVYPNTNISLSCTNSEMAEAIGLTPEKITKGQTILGIEGNAETGIDTSDATATVNDIAQDKTAYVNGEKITGTLKKLFELSYIVNNVVWTDETDLDQLRLDIPLLGDGIVTSNQTKTVVILHYDKLAEEIGLTADKIKAGETILGITGTYTGETVES